MRSPFLAAVCLALAAAGCSQGSEPSLESVDSATSSQDVVDYGKEPIVLRAASDVRKLTGAPDGFKQFIAGVTDATTSGIDPEGECPPQVEVSVIVPKGFAAGAIRACNGAAHIWAKKNGVWQQIWAGQSDPDCAAMKSNDVPEVIAGEQCWADGELVPYSR